MLRRLGDALVRRAVHSSRASDIVEDLHEEYSAHQRPTRGPIVAAAWYLRQIVLTLAVSRQIGSPSRPPRPARWNPGQSVRDAAFFLRRRPRLLLVVTLLVGPCIGVNVAIFNVLDGMLFRQLPYPGADRIVQLQQRKIDTGQAFGTLGFAELEAARAIPGVEAATAFFGSGPLFYVETGASVRELSSVRVDEHFATVFALPLPAGRSFTTHDVRSGHPVAMISHRLWTEHFGRRPIAGMPLKVAGRSLDIVGVLPADFLFPSFLTTSPIDVLVPFAPKGNDRVMAAARLAPGASPIAVEAALNAATESLRAGAPGTNIRVRGLLAALFELHRPTLWLVLAAGLVVLGAAALNLGILLRAVNHEREADFAVRLALGASRSRLVWQVIAETWLLVLAASLAAGLACYAGFGALTRALPSPVYRIMAHGFDARTWMFVALSLLAVTAVAGAVLISGALRVSSAPSLKPALASPRTTLRRYSPLVAAQVAIGIAVSMIAASLLMTYLSKSAEQLGFEPEGAFTIGVRYPPPNFADAASRIRLGGALLEAARSTPGVVAAGSSSGLPLTGAAPEWGLPEGSPLPRSGGWYATPGFFAAAGVPLHGREFTDADRTTAAIVSKRFADTVWPGEDAIGKTVVLGAPFGTRVVVGVAGNMHPRFDEIADPAVYVPHGATPRPLGRMVVRLPDTSEAGRAQLLTALRNVDPRAVITLTPLEALVERSLAFPRFQAMLFSTMGMLTLLLAVAGTYIAARQSVTSRTREIGVRLGLGSTYARAQADILRQQVPPVLAGAVAGLLVAYLAGEWAVTLVGPVGTPSFDKWLVSAGLFVALALAATFIAARRVLRIDPAALLRTS